MKRLALALLIVLMPGLTFAQGTNCGPRKFILTRLAEQYGEARVAYGLNARQLLMEVFANATTGSWTVTLTQADGLTCVVSVGSDFNPVTDGPAPKDEPA